MNTIAQGWPKFPRLLKARQRIYSDATRCHILQIVLTTALPVLGALLAFTHQQTRPYVRSMA
jgi:hypothetical protein